MLESIRFSILPHCHRDDGGRLGECNADGPAGKVRCLMVSDSMKVVNAQRLASRTGRLIEINRQMQIQS